MNDATRKPDDWDRYEKLMPLCKPLGEESRCENIRRLFDEANAKRKREGKPHCEAYLFSLVFGDGVETLVKHLLPFLHDVSTCPEAVLNECRRIINPPKHL